MRKTPHAFIEKFIILNKRDRFKKRLLDNDHL